MFLFPNLRKLTAQTYALWSLKALTKLLSKTNQAKRCLVSNKIIHRATPIKMLVYSDENIEPDGNSSGSNVAIKIIREI